mgnify:CR=1 FL=1
MAALTQDRSTLRRDGGLIEPPVAAATRIWAAGTPALVMAAITASARKVAKHAVHRPENRKNRLRNPHRAKWVMSPRSLRAKSTAM